MRIISADTEETNITVLLTFSVEQFQLSNELCHGNLLLFDLVPSQGDEVQFFPNDQEI